MNTNPVTPFPAGRRRNMDIQSNKRACNKNIVEETNLAMSAGFGGSDNSTNHSKAENMFTDQLSEKNQNENIAISNDIYVEPPVFNFLLRYVFMWAAIISASVILVYIFRYFTSGLI